MLNRAVFEFLFWALATLELSEMTECSFNAFLFQPLSQQNSSCCLGGAVSSLTVDQYDSQKLAQLGSYRQ